ncbi:MAG: glycine--tRNA ligase subunit beta [Porticoccaceae bacterium]
MSADFLVEIGTEELPPKVLRQLCDSFAEGITSRLSAEQLQFGEVTIFGAPRRLALLVKDLETQTPDQDVVNWGPPAKVAFDSDGNPTRAAEAFAKKNGLELSALSGLVENDGQQEKLCARRTVAGSPTESLLGDIINQSLSALPIPKPMRWGKSRQEFVRPVQWAVVLFDSKTIHSNILGIESSNISRGHRFHSQGDILIESPASYKETLYKAFVIVDFEERRELIRQGVIAAAKSAGGTAVIDDDLLDEVSALNEWPVPLLGHFEEHFLEVPAEALVSSMAQHQKYFHVVDSDNKLKPLFITVANIDSLDPQQVISGNERVIRPRLADAAFFYKTDLKSTLQTRRETLKSVVFQSKLGSIYDKTERVSGLAKILADYTGASPQHAERAGELCKSDLVSEMVGEFDDLQGVMGRYYALNDGEDPAVAEALMEQYLPRFAGDAIPATETGAALALADRLDTLVGIFSIGQQPSGSRDPFALRRASLGILRIIIERNIDLDLKLAISAAARQLEITEDADKLCLQVLTYVLERFKAWYRDEGIDAEVFASVAALELSNPLDIDARVKAVDQFTGLPEAVALASANKRVFNILAKQAADTVPSTIDNSLLVDSAEQQLAESISALSGAIAPLLEQRDYEAVLKELASLRKPVDQFFDDVMVMVDDPAVRDNRLALLNSLRSLFLNVADISQLVVSK